MNKALILLAIVLVVFSSLVIGGYHFFGIGGAILGVIICVFLVRLAIKMVTTRVMGIGKALFESKSKVLRGASAKLHSISAAPAVDTEDMEAADRGVPTRFYFLDVTITPAPANGTTPFTMWDSSELMLLPFDAEAPTLDSPEPEENEEDKCAIHDVAFVDGDEEGKTTGEQRLKLHVEVPEAVKRLKLQYYFETFGDFAVPS